MFNKPTKASRPSKSGSGIRSTALAILLFGAGLCVVNSQRVQSQFSVAPTFRESQVIVQLKPGSLIDGVNARNDTTTLKHLAGTNFYLLQVAAGADEVVSVTDLELDSSVLDASLNRVVESPFTSLSQSIMSFPDGYAVPNQPSTEYYRQKQALEGQLNLAAAHMRSRGAGTTLAVIDTGIDRTHPVLAGHLWVDDRQRADIPGNGIDDDLDGLVDDAYGWDFVEEDADPTEFPGDPQTTVAGHGTFIAGLAAILAPDCRIMPIRAFTPEGESDEFTVAEALKFATDHGADVISMSFGTPDDSPILSEAIGFAYQQQVIMVAAVGNEATDTPPLYPSHYHEYVMGVTAVDANDKLAFFSNFGNRISMSAPGKSIVSTYPGAGYALWSGTSFSAPLVAAEAALLISADRDKRFTRRVIEQTALNIDGLNSGFEGLMGIGRLRPLNALRALNTNPALNPTLDLQSRIELTSGEGFPDAKGSAEVFVTGAVQDVRINADGLTPRAAYRLMINGQAQPDSVTATAFGSVEVFMSNNPGVKTIPLPAAFQPVTRVDRVELRDGLGRLVLEGDFDPVVGIAKPKQMVLKEAHLFTPPLTSQLTQAGPSGVARVEADSERQVLSITLETPTNNGVYGVLIDGVSICKVNSHFGALSVSYSSNPPSDGLLPQAILPLCNVRQITILDSAGRVVAGGTFRITGASLGTG